MKVKQEIFEYLKGQKFSNGLNFQIPHKFHNQDRISLLKTLCENKNIIHLGCLDHIELIDAKLENNTWLHKELSDFSKKCIGIDINIQGVEFVKNKYGYQNIIAHDILDEPLQSLKSQNWDSIVLGELLEHINDPVYFLKKIKENYEENIKNIIITVPNILNLKYFKYMQKRTELVNTDHRYWFTPYTILKVAVEAGLIPEDIYFASRIPLSFTKLALLKILKNVFRITPVFPFYYFNNIVLVCKLN